MNKNQETSPTRIKRSGSARGRSCAIIAALLLLFCRSNVLHAQATGEPRLAGVPQEQSDLPGTASPNSDEALPEAPKPTAIPDVTQVNPTVGCVQPAPLLRWQDYQGPFAKLVVAVDRKVERKSVTPHQAHFKAGVLLCTFTLKSKVRLAGEDMIDPFTVLNMAFNAGISQATNGDRAFGQGAQGYGKRFGAAAADQASGDFFKFILYPTIFAEDPRYYRLGEGTGKQRFVHALAHAVMAHNENGGHMFNFSEWLGTASTSVLSNTYHPGNKPGFGPAAERMGFSIGNDMGYDVVREFWPEIVRKFHLPFRDDAEPKS